jgi:hypothetical protein
MWRHPSDFSSRFPHFPKTIPDNSMIRILASLVVSASALLAASCCCTSDTKPPRLRPLPQFQEIESAPEPAPEVYGTK